MNPIPFNSLCGYPLDEGTIASYAPVASGVYGLYKSRGWIYIDDADEIRHYLFAHVRGAFDLSPGLSLSAWIFIFAKCDKSSSGERKEALIREYRPKSCNVTDSTALARDALKLNNLHPLPRGEFLIRFLCSVTVLSLLTTAPSLSAQKDYFSGWPQGDSPQEVGKRLAEHFVTSPHQYTATLFYAEDAAWYGALRFSQLTHDQPLQKKLIEKFEPIMPRGAEQSRIPVRHHVDDSIFGIVPLEIAIETKNPKYLNFGVSWADRQWEDPKPDGLSAETRYWIDDMYMLVILQLEAYRATGDKKYLDRDAQEMVAYLDRLQQPNGLFFHAPDVPFFWARGNGWVAAGMAELLLDLPANHPLRTRILKSYTAMMVSLLHYQGKDGMWRQLLDHEEAWPETSGSAMFTFALITGVKNGWLNQETYGPAARKGWIAVVGYIDQNAEVTNVCEGTSRTNNLEFYLQRRRRTGDFHGQAPVLWAASALLR